MVVDSSVLIAILLGEDDVQQFIQLLADAEKIYISAVSFVESAMVIEHKKGESGAKKYDELLTVLSANIVVFDNQQARLARIAWQNYGKGRHPAKLNFGDCCSYAAAKFLDLPLLFKGNDFSQTDIQRGC